jgi:DNA-binding transcriptional LysR family regulator
MPVVIEPRILSRLVYFVAVAETQAFTRAAERLGITKAVVSQQVARLEAELGTSLFVRTTRRVELTEPGRILYERAVGVLQEAQDAVTETTQANSRPQGTLRIVAPNAYGTLMIVPAVTKFLSSYPECRADLRFNDRIVDILTGEIDVAIRVGWLIDSSLRARRLGTFQQLLVASHRFASRVKRVTSPEGLEALPFVGNTALPEPETWLFSNRAGARTTFNRTATLAIDSTHAVHAALLAGAGFSILPDFMVAQDIAAGRLVHLLPQWQLPEGGIYAVFPSARFRAPRVAVFIELLASMINSIEHT